MFPTKSLGQLFLQMEQKSCRLVLQPLYRDCGNLKEEGLSSRSANLSEKGLLCALFNHLKRTLNLKQSPKRKSLRNYRLKRKKSSGLDNFPPGMSKDAVGVKAKPL